MEKIKEWLSGFVALKYLPRFFRLIYKSSPSYFISNVALRLVKSILPVIMLWVGKEIIDQVILHTQNQSIAYTRLYTLIGIELGLAILNDVLNRLISMTETLLGTRYSDSSSIELIQKTAGVEIADLEDSEFYDKLERARRQTVTRVFLLSNILAQAQDLITIVSLIAALIYFYPILILLLAISVIPSFINELHFSKSNFRMNYRMAPERRELDYMRVLGASDVTAKEVKLFGLVDFITDTFSRIAEKFYKEKKTLETQRTIYGAIFHILSDLAYYGAYIFILFKATAAVISIGQLKDIKLLSTPTTIQKGFEFRNVSFTYPGNTTSVFNNVSFHIHKGEKIALVGENGSGKTTLIKLLLRFYEPTEGEILLDGVNIKNYDKLQYQQLFGAIFQDFVKYYLSAKMNIAVGNIEEKENMNKIKTAAELSLADDFIMKYDDTYDQVLGKRFKKGTELSGGQWQKVAIARAYMTESECVILDEPTSALDARAEFEVFQRFIGLTKGKTSIIISHRFSTVRMADRILVLDKGSIIEDGTHEELLNEDGLYAELFNLQAEGYM